MAKILIVDDEPRIRDLIREHLQYAGFTCEEAGDGTAALSVLSQGGIDLVILDIMISCQQQGHRPQPREDPAKGLELRLLRRGPHRGYPYQDAARPSGPLPQLHRHRMGHRVQI